MPPPPASPSQPRPTRPLADFFATETASAAVLLAATVVAVAVANSVAGDGYRSIWSARPPASIGPLHLPEDLRHWVNEGLMALFFFVVGLEIKRETRSRELSTWRTASVPVVAALGGMVVPALVYLSFNAGGSGSRGWGIPMATDIAFAVGLVALVGPRVPNQVRTFLLTLAVVDDVGAIVVIALFYSAGISGQPLAAAAALVAVMAGLWKAGFRSVTVYALLSVGVWLAVLQSGLHATLAGVALGLLCPPGDGGRGVSAERLESALHRWTGLVIVPLFALANAGLVLDTESVRRSLGSSVTMGVALGLVVGKIVGITGGTWLMVRWAGGRLDPAIGLRHVAGVSAIAGVGFTVSLFVTGLAFESPAQASEAQVGVFVASLVAAVIGTLALRAASRPGST